MLQYGLIKEKVEKAKEVFRHDCPFFFFQIKICNT